MASIGQLDIIISAKADQVLKTLDSINANLGKLSEQNQRAARDSDRLAKAVEKDSARMGAALTKVKVIAVAVATAFAGVASARAMDAAAEKVDKIGKVAARLGERVEDVSALRFAAGKAGVEFDALATLASKAEKAVAGLVAQGTKELRLGGALIELTDATGRIRPLTQLLPDIARGLGKVRDNAEQLRLADKIFGKAGGEQFIQLMRESGGFIANLAEQTERARRLNVIFDESQVRKLTAYRDAVSDLKEAWFGVRVEVMTELAPALTKFLNEAAERIADLPDLVRAVGNAVGLAANSPDLQVQQDAAEKLAELKTATTRVLVTAATESGRVLAVAFLEAVTAGFVAVTPAIEDVLRDAVGGALNKAAGVEVVTPSLRAQLAAEQRVLEGQQSKLRELLGPDSMSRLNDPKFQQELALVRADLIWLEDKIRRLDPEDPGLILKHRRNELISELEQMGDPLTVAARMSPQIEAQQKKVDALAKAVKADDVDRAKRLADAFSGGFEATATAAARASERIGEAVDAFDTARTSVVAFYGEAQEGEAAQERGPDRLQRLQARVAAFVVTVRDRAVALGEFSKEALAAEVELRDIEARRLRAVGDRAGATQLELQGRFLRERLELSAKVLKGELPEFAIDRLDAAQAAELGEALAKLRDEATREARQVRIDVIPQAAFDEQMERLEKLRAEFPTIIDDEAFAKARERLDRHFERMLADAGDFRAQAAVTVRSFAGDASNAFAEMVVDGKASFDQLLKAWAKTLLSMAAQKFAFQPLFDALGNAIGSAGRTGAGSVGSIGGAEAGSAPSYGASEFAAHGLVLARGRVVPFAKGGVVNRPTLFPMATGAGLMGEAGPEAIMPLERIGGDLGVRAVGGGVVVNINDHRTGGEQAEVTERRGPDGQRIIDITIRDAVRRMVADGSLDRHMASSYGLTRRTAGR